MRAVPEARKTAGDWQAFHIFYSANPRPLLLQCVEPLVKALTIENLLAGYFFINYWLEGPHLRLRLRPSSPEAGAPVRQRANQAIADFLRKRPALYEVPPGFLDDLYSTFIELEYSKDQRARLMGPDGKMRLRKSNTFSLERYEPEYGKYGGPAGVGLAEWHFQRSSDLVIAAARTVNLHLRTVALGFAAQLMAVMSSCLIPDEDALAEFLESYRDYWNEASTGTATGAESDFADAYDTIGAPLAQRFQRIRAAVADGALDQLPGTQRAWAQHCLELRGRALDLTRRGELVFRSWAGNKDERITDPALTLPRLLSPYLHMTNNRLSLGIRDEAYLSYVLTRALREPNAVGS
jgi:Lantibiotic biosynthesis dehydratase C-term